VSTLAAIPNVLLLIAVAGCGLVFAVAGRDRSNDSGIVFRADRCRARAVFAELQTASFLLDALIETSDDLTVPPGTPFSLRLVPPDGSDDYLFSQLRATVERGHPFFVEVEESQAGRKARLGANGWITVLQVEHTSGWPSTAPVEVEALPTIWDEAS